MAWPGSDPWYGYGPNSMYARGMPRRRAASPGQQIPAMPTAAQTSMPGDDLSEWPPQGMYMPPPSPAVPEGIWNRMKAGITDPRMRTMLLTVAANMGAPRQFGQTGWGQFAQAIGQGYNSLAMSQLMQSQAQAAMREEARKDQELRIRGAEAKSKIGKEGAEAQKTQAETGQVAPLAGSQVSLRGAQAKKATAEAEVVPRETAVKEGQLNLDKEKAKNDLTLRMEELALAQRKLEEAERMGKSDRELNVARAYAARVNADARKELNKILGITKLNDPAATYSTYTRLMDILYETPLPGEDTPEEIERRFEDAHRMAIEVMKKTAMLNQEGQLRAPKGGQVTKVESKVTESTSGGTREGTAENLKSAKPGDIFIRPEDKKPFRLVQKSDGSYDWEEVKSGKP